jgi:FKBP-type peptidyl-prolyl cis-trans isomerase
MFDQNYDNNEGFRFKLGQGQVIQGWDQGLVGLKTGGVRRLVIPAALAYGAQGSGSTIPPNSDLVFTVKLIAIK